MAQRGRPKKVVVVRDEIQPLDSVINDEKSGTSVRFVAEFDRDLFNASAVIAGAMAAGQGGWAPVISKTAVKVAKELLEIVKEG